MVHKTQNLVKAGIFLALGLIVPYFFHMAGMLGSIFLPMHIPVLLCGFMLGRTYGLAVGIITPLMNAFLTGMPPLYPTGVSMALELGAYGLISGYLFRDRNMNIFVSLTIAMVLGRLVSGAANYILLFANGKSYLLETFIAASFVQPVWGIILQFVLIPTIVELTRKGAVR